MREIFIHTDYLTLGQFLKFAGVISNGGESKVFLEEHCVFVNGMPENRRGRKLYEGYIVVVDALEYLVKRQRCE